MQTLYEQNPKAWQKLAADGCPSIAEMAHHFNKCADMNRALDVAGSSHWLSERNGASQKTERRARAWLDDRRATPQIVATPDPQLTMLLVSGSPALLAKAKKIVEMIGCDAVDI
jgi:hypothetical protein